jgi:hypothetical protein
VCYPFGFEHFPCDNCDKSFATQRSLQLHERSCNNNPQQTLNNVEEKIDQILQAQKAQEVDQKKPAIQFNFEENAYNCEFPRQFGVNFIFKIKFDRTTFRKFKKLDFSEEVCLINFCRKLSRSTKAATVLVDKTPFAKKIEKNQYQKYFFEDSDNDEKSSLLENESHQDSDDEDSDDEEKYKYKFTNLQLAITESLTQMFSGPQFLKNSHAVLTDAGGTYSEEDFLLKTICKIAKNMIDGR